MDQFDKLISELEEEGHELESRSYGNRLTFILEDISGD